MECAPDLRNSGCFAWQVLQKAQKVHGDTEVSPPSSGRRGTWEYLRQWFSRIPPLPEMK